MASNISVIVDDDSLKLSLLENFCMEVFWMMENNRKRQEEVKESNNKK